MARSTTTRRKGTQVVKAAAVAKSPKSAARPNAVLDIPLGAAQERVAAIREGVPAAAVLQISGRLRMPKARLYESLQFPRATVDRKIKAGGKLTADQSERLLGLQRLILEVQRTVEESGSVAGFDAAAWVGAWLEAPLPALGQRRPAEYMDTIEGQNLVVSLLRRAHAGTYA